MDLFTLIPITLTPELIYTPPTGGNVVLKKLIVTRVSGLTVSLFSLYVDPFGTRTTDAQAVYKAFEVPADQTIQIDLNIPLKSGGANVYVQSSILSTLKFSLIVE